MNYETFKQAFKGRLITAEDLDYDSLRDVYMGKGTPALIAQPLDADDVSSAVAYARDNKLILSVRSGGHSGAGFSTNNDGVVIDLSTINSVEVIDSEQNIVRIGGGAKWGDVADVLRTQGLAISSGDTKSVGVGGLTLGGGIGWMVRKYGLAIDSLVGAEVVLADGTIVRTSNTENSDLLWAIRGGGGNFGVVTYFEFAAQKVGQVYFGTLMFGLESIGQVLKNWRDYMRTAGDDLTSSMTLMPPIGEYPSGAMLLFCYAGGDDEEAKLIIESLKNLGKVNSEDIQKKDYADVLEEAHPPAGVKAVVKNLFAKELTDNLIDAVAEAAGKRSVMQVRYLGGAFSRVSNESTAFAHRDSEIMMFSGTFVPLDASEEQINEAMKPWQYIASFGSGAYANFISTTSEQDVKDVYPDATYEKLAHIKKTYDPNNLFNQNYNIKP